MLCFLRIRLVRTVIAIALLGLLCAGCNTIFPTPVKKILDNPRDYAGKQVTISGEVTETFGLLVIKYFIVKDSTGEITVITDKPLPKKGDRIRVKGAVREAFSLGDKQALVIMEKMH